MGRTLGYSPLVAAIVCACGGSVDDGPAGEPIKEEETVARGTFHAVAESPSADVGGTCSLQGVGIVGPSPPSLPVEEGQAMSGAPVEDGGDYAVSCFVDGGGTGAIQIEVVGPNTGGSGGTAKLTIHGTFGSDGKGIGGAVLWTIEVGSVSSPAMGCTFETLEEVEQERRGAAFTFVCPSTSFALDGFAVCQLRGTVAVDWCD